MQWDSTSILFYRQWEIRKAAKLAIGYEKAPGQLTAFQRISSSDSVVWSG